MVGVSTITGNLPLSLLTRRKPAVQCKSTFAEDKALEKRMFSEMVSKDHRAFAVALRCEKRLVAYIPDPAKVMDAAIETMVYQGCRQFVRYVDEAIYAESGTVKISGHQISVFTEPPPERVLLRSHSKVQFQGGSKTCVILDTWDTKSGLTKWTTLLELAQKRGLRTIVNFTAPLDTLDRTVFRELPDFVIADTNHWSSNGSAVTAFYMDARVLSDCVQIMQSYSSDPKRDGLTTTFPETEEVNLEVEVNIERLLTTGWLHQAREMLRPHNPVSKVYLRVLAELASLHLQREMGLSRMRDPTPGVVTFASRFQPPHGTGRRAMEAEALAINRLVQSSRRCMPSSMYSPKCKYGLELWPGFAECVVFKNRLAWRFSIAAHRSMKDWELSCALLAGTFEDEFFAREQTVYDDPGRCEPTAPKKTKLTPTAKPVKAAKTESIASKPTTRAASKSTSKATSSRTSRRTFSRTSSRTSSRTQAKATTKQA